MKVTVLTADGGCDVTRRFNAERDVISCYAGLIAKISGVFPGLHPDQFNTYWKGKHSHLKERAFCFHLHLAAAFILICSFSFILFF